MSLDRGTAEGAAAARKPLISGNWKMNHTHLDAINVVQRLAFRLESADYEATEVSLHPAFTALRSVQTLLDVDKIPISLGAQNVHWEEKGAYTGEISPIMLAKLNVRYVIIGHSERRHYFGETDEDVNRKAKAVIGAGMLPILCVGETTEDRAAGRTEDRIVEEVRAGLARLAPEAVADSIIAYEPRWAIGTGETAKPEEIAEISGLIRSTVSADFGEAAAAGMRIQYGGSVDGDSAPAILALRDVDGLLVGGASLDADRFALVIGAARALAPPTPASAGRRGRRGGN